MKKSGFTLAEVLITLAIIGVVATMTLPALISNTNEQQAKTALKKGINTLTEAGQMNAAIDGWSYSDVSSAGNIDENTVDTQSLYAIFAKRLNIDYTKMGGLVAPAQEPAPPEIVPRVNTYLYLRDGTGVYFSSTVVGSVGDFGGLEDDGLPRGYDIIFDTNGPKGPNLLSNCLGVTGGVDDETEPAACNNKAQRVIKDQFVVRLRGAIAVPKGGAANWAFNN